MSSHDHTTSIERFQSLIPFTKQPIDSEVQETVNGRDLHANLEIGKEYRSWFRAQIKSLGLIQNIDFIPVTQKVGLAQGGSYTETEYFLTIEAAKHVALASRTQKGREIRAYFIEAERRLREGKQSVLSNHRDLAVMQETLVAIAEARDAARIADEKAEQALLLGQKAFQAQMSMTLRYYRYAHGLIHQINDKMLEEFSHYIMGYCLEIGIPVTKEPIADRKWGYENRYPVAVIAELLPGWVARYHAQTSLSAEA